MKPPYTITPSILKLVAAISERIGEVNAAHLSKPPAELRKKNRIKTIQASLEIEGNQLSIKQVTALLEDKRILGPPKDIMEVQNAITLYAALEHLNPFSLKSFCEAHGVLMHGLVDTAGKFRNSSVGIAKGKEVTHIAPSSERLLPLMKDLFAYLKNEDELMLIKSCVFHYEMEFIHPFLDGNGRMGRLWQTLILKEAYPIFEFLPVEHLIKLKQKQYYDALAKSDNSGESTIFIQFMLEIILTALTDLLSTQNVSLTATDRIQLFQTIIHNKNFTRKDYLQRFKEISSATASRDLRFGVEMGWIVKKGEKRLSTYTYTLQ